VTTATRAIVYQASDLNRKGRAILDAAHRGEARIRDTDGVSLLVLSEERVQIGRELLQLASNVLTVEEALSIPEKERTALAYGDWTWLRHLDEADRHEFHEELLRLLAVALRERSVSAVDAVEETVDAWRVTAEALADSGRREVLLGTHNDGDFIEVGRPQAIEAVSA
jgi:hypothetical protein